MKTRETFSGASRHPKKIICVAIRSRRYFSSRHLNGAIHWGAQRPLEGAEATLAWPHPLLYLCPLHLAAGAAWM